MDVRFLTWKSNLWVLLLSDKLKVGSDTVLNARSEFCDSLQKYHKSLKSRKHRICKTRYWTLRSRDESNFCRLKHNFNGQLSCWSSEATRFWKIELCIIDDYWKLLRTSAFIRIRRVFILKRFLISLKKLNTTALFAENVFTSGWIVRFWSRKKPRYFTVEDLGIWLSSIDISEFAITLFFYIEQ